MSHNYVYITINRLQYFIYHEAELSKGETVYDRCVAKFLDVHDRISKELTSMYMTKQLQLSKCKDRNSD